MGTNDTLVVIFTRVAESVRLNSGETVGPNESIRVNIVSGINNHTYKLKRNGVDVSTLVTTSLNGDADVIFTPGGTGGLVRFAIVDAVTLESRPAWGIDVTITGGGNGGTGGTGISKTWIVLGLIAAGVFLLGGKKIKW